MAMYLLSVKTEMDFFQTQKYNDPEKNNALEVANLNAVCNVCISFFFNKRKWKKYLKNKTLAN